MLKLDQRDIQILSHLQLKGRISSTELAEAVNLSVSPCWKRVKRLESEGLIRGYSADLCAADFGLLELLVTLELTSHHGADFRRFEQYLNQTPEVVDLWAVGGGIDYVARFTCDSLSCYQALMDSVLDAQVGLHRYYTYVITKTVKQAKLPLETLKKKSA